MCGIAGILGPTAAGQQRALEMMLEVQRHRGPDDSGIHLDGGVAIGQNRLSIVDLSSCGHQPMLVDGGRLALVYNGEVYNHKELRADLESRGHRFFSASDTEVIARAYDEWGTECVSRFNGMWAFALYDRDRSRVWCSRDRLGVKPLYYVFDAGRFMFSSEIKGILAAAPEYQRADERHLGRFLRTALVDDVEETFFAGVRQLMPGMSMEIGLRPDGASIDRMWRYWNFELERVNGSYDFNDVPGQIRELLSDAVRLRLRSDVPVGTCLSGGLDSSSIVGLASGALTEPVWTFSAIYEEPGYDESRFVKLVNDAFATNAHEVRPEPGRLHEVMESLAWHQDTPSVGPGLYSQWHVMENAKEGVTVLLDGQGADELLGGYWAFYADYLRSRALWASRRPTPGRLSRLMSDLQIVLQRAGGAGAGPAAALRQIVLGYLSEDAKRVLRRVVPGESRGEISPELLSMWQGEDPWKVTGPFDDRLRNALYTATFRTSLPALLRYEDRSSMAFSLEARTPFLDYRLVEYLLALPFDQRIDGEWTKIGLRRAMDGLLPDEVTWRKDKLGYPTPFAKWLRTVFREDAEAVINSPEFLGRGIFEGEECRRMWQQHLSGERDNSWHVWRWLSTEYWHRRFIDGPLQPPPTPAVRPPRHTAQEG